MKIYIIGNDNSQRGGDAYIQFGQIANQLQMAGVAAVNPLALISSEWQWQQRMRARLTELLTCDAVCLLPQWSQSANARLEMALAKNLNYPAFVGVEEVVRHLNES